MIPEIEPKEIGFTGLKQWSGYVSEEFLPELRGASAMRRYREMRDNSAILGACFEGIAKLFRQYSFEWEPSQDGPDAVRIAEFFTGALDDLDVPFADVIEGNQSMFTFGWEIRERRLKRRAGMVMDPATGAPDPARTSKYADGLVSWGRFAERAQESTAGYKPWDISDDGGTILAWSQVDASGNRRTILASKFLHFRTTRLKNNPEGRSLLRNAWFSWLFFKRISESEAVGIARDLTGLAVFELPAAWFSPEAQDWQKDLVTQYRQVITSIARGENEGIVMPVEYDNQQKVIDLKLLSSGGKRQFDTEKIIERYERRMAMVLLSDLILMGHESTGSFALSDNKKGLLEVAIEGHAWNIVGTYQKDAPIIMAMNGWPLELTPRLVPKAKPQLEPGPLGDIIAKMSAAGFDWNKDKDVDNLMRDLVGLPRRKSEPKKEDLTGDEKK